MQSDNHLPLLFFGFVIVILKHIYLSFMTFQPIFYLCYIYYSGSLILCCQYVANMLPLHYNCTKATVQPLFRVHRIIFRKKIYAILVHADSLSLRMFCQ